MIPIDMPKTGETKIRFDLYSSPRFRVFGDLYSNKRLFLHLDWSNPKMTPSAFKEFVNAIAMIRNAAKASGFESINTLVPPSLVKFESLWGFKVVNVYVFPEGQMVHMQQAV